MSDTGFEKQDRNPSEDRMRVREAASRICEWYAASRRVLPWREDPTPYHTWIAEIMLQQTRIEAVIPYYQRFLESLPDIPSLAAVSEDRLLKLWEGLGYYSRARNLKKAAMLLTENYGGELPASAEELRKLPGIGDYTAGSIASISFGLPEPAVDGNVLRVLSRLLACPDDIAKTAVRRRAAELLREAYPTGREAGVLTEGIMELGETVCLPNAVPRCGSCPLRTVCLAHLAGEELSYPVKSAAGKRRVEEKTVFLLRCGDRFARAGSAPADWRLGPPGGIALFLRRGQAYLYARGMADDRLSRRVYRGRGRISVVQRRGDRKPLFPADGISVL